MLKYLFICKLKKKKELVPSKTSIKVPREVIKTTGFYMFLLLIQIKQNMYISSNFIMACLQKIIINQNKIQYQNRNLPIMEYIILIQYNYYLYCATI